MLPIRPFLSLAKDYITTALARRSAEDFGRRSGIVPTIKAGALHCLACGTLPGNPEACVKTDDFFDFGIQPVQQVDLTSVQPFPERLDSTSCRTAIHQPPTPVVHVCADAAGGSKEREKVSCV